MSATDDCHRCSADIVITPVRDDDGEILRTGWNTGIKVFVDVACSECDMRKRTYMPEQEYAECDVAPEPRGQSRLQTFGGATNHD